MSDLARRSSLRRRGPVALEERWSEDDRVRRRVAAGQRTALLARGKVFRGVENPKTVELYRRMAEAKTPYPSDVLSDEELDYIAAHPPMTVTMGETLSRWQRFRRDLRVRWIEWYELGSAGPRVRRILLRVTAPFRRVRYYARWRFYDWRRRFQLSAPGRLLWRIRRFFS